MVMKSRTPNQQRIVEMVPGELFGHAPDRQSQKARLVLDNDRIVACNRTAPLLFRCQQEELLGESLLALSAPTQPDGLSSARSLRLKHAAVSSGQVQHFDWLCLHLDGGTFAARATLSPMEVRGKLLTELLLSDIREHVLAEDAWRRAYNDLEGRLAERSAELARSKAELQGLTSELERAEQALVRRNKLMQALNKLAEQAATSLELQPLYEAAVKSSAELIDATSAYISEIDFDAGTTTVVAEYMGSRATPAERFSDLGTSYDMEKEFGTSAEALLERVEPYVIHIDDPDLSPAERAHMERYDAKSILGIPLIVEGMPVAEVEFWESRRKRDFTPEEFELVEAIARQIAVPVENARLYSQAVREIEERRQLELQIRRSLERRGRQVQLSSHVTQDIADADLGDLYQRVVKRTKEQFGYYHVQLLRFEPALKALVLIAGYGEIGEQMLASGYNVPIGSGYIGVAAATGKSVLRPDVSDDPTWRSSPLLPDARGELAVPIMLGDEVLGVLDAQSDEADALDEEDQLALEGLSGQIAIAIESTRLREEMAARLEELDRLQRIMSREGWRAYRAQRERDRKGYQFDQSTIVPVGVPSPESEDGRKEDGPARQQDSKSVYVAPMTVRGETIGTLGIADDPDRPLPDEDRQLLDSISVQVAEALEQARLLEQTQQHAVQMEAVAQVSAVVSTILEAEKLLETVVRLTLERFDLYQVAVFALDEDELRLAAGARLPADSLDIDHWPDLNISDETSPVVRASQSGFPVVVHDVRQEPGYVVDPTANDTRSELAIPLIVGDTVLGVLDLQSELTNRFSENDVRIHTTLGAQVAVALQNAILYAEQLETAARLREVDRLKSEFLASMSHELRTPLNSIIGFADVLLEGIDGPLNERMHEDVTLIRDSGRHLRELIGEMLDMSKIEAGVMELRYEEIDVPLLAREIVASAKSLAKNKDLEIRLEVDPDLKTVEADRTRLTQILLNLVGNAIKFTEHGSICLILKEQDGDLLAGVQDTGIGIANEDIPIIFEQFRQIDGSLSRKVGGTGLGVPISKRLVELHGGQMWLESEPGVGSTFWFTMPKKGPLDDAKVSTSIPEATALQSQMSPRSVDD
jgi:signal transduction histidine kinase